MCHGNPNPNRIVWGMPDNEFRCGPFGPRSIHANNMSVSVSLLLSLVMVSELRWHTSEAQILALQHAFAFKDTPTYVVQKELEVGSEEYKQMQELAKRSPAFTLYGIPVVIHSEMNQHMIELRNGDDVLVRLDGLAIPQEFANADPFHDQGNGTNHRISQCNESCQEGDSIYGPPRK